MEGKKQAIEKLKNMKKRTMEKLKKEITLNNFINSIWLTIITGILLVAKTMFFYKETVFIIDRFETFVVKGTIIFIISLVAVVLALPKKARTITTIIVNVLLSILLFMDDIYFTYSSNIISIEQISNLQYGGEIMATLPAIVKWKHILYFIDIIVFIAMLLFAEVKIKKQNKKSKRKTIAKILTGLAGIIIFYFGFIEYIDMGDKAPFDKGLQIKWSTIYGYHIWDIENAIVSRNKTAYETKERMMKDYETLKADYEERYGEEQYNLEGILDGKNIIIVQLESIQKFVTNKKINGKAITPNIDKFLKENIEFTNMHMQSYSTTADSEHSVINSIYPVENGMAYAKYYTNKYDSLYQVFNKANYYTSYMHGNVGKFWNRENVYRPLAINDLALLDQFEDYEYVSGYLSDEALYVQAVDKFKNYEEPFISLVVAASSHTPFELWGLEDRSKITIDVGEYKDTNFGKYLESVNYADYCFGVFIDKLKEEGLYEDTAILIFGDHNGISMYEAEMLDFFEKAGIGLTDVDVQLNYTNVVCGLKIPGTRSRKISKPVSKLDIKPTFCYLCNIDDGFSLGTNMFGNKDFVCTNNERIIAKDYYYDGQYWYDISNGEVLDMENINEELKNKLDRYYKNMKTELNISNSIVINNLLK